MQRYNRRAIGFCNKNLTQVAAYFCDVARFHKKTYEIIGNIAAACVIQLNAKKRPRDYILDLHYHHVPEAKAALDIFLDCNIKRLREENEEECRVMEVTTGRGRRSIGNIPKIKPAIVARLEERGINPSEKNPGSLLVRVYPRTLMTHEFG